MQRHAIRKMFTVGLLSILSFLVACGTSPEDTKALRDDQAKILAKLADLDKKIDQIAKRAPQPPPARRGPDPAKKYSFPVGSSAVLGPKDAPVTIIEFSDFQCPFCARTAPLIEEALKAYPKDANFVYKHFPLVSIHRNAMDAAKATVAAQKQGKFWEMHDIVFKNQRALQRDKLSGYAKEIGLDVAQFDKDMDDPTVQKQVQDDMRLAQATGIRGTPTIFVNGKLLQDRSVDGFKRMIDAALKEKK